jgi:hypothetical protein
LLQFGANAADTGRVIHFPRKAPPLKTRLILGATATCAFVAVPTAMAVEGAPLPKRDGVVVAWQPRSHTAVVVTADQIPYAIHTLRRVAPGTRVRVEGIKWGAPTSGIKWSVAPSGIKWGIKWAANKSYQSRLTKLSGTATTMSLRGTVVRRFGGRAVAISIPGATTVIPLRGAVWLPTGGKGTNAVTPLNRFGTKVTVRVRFDSKGRAFSRRVVEIAPAGPQTEVPVAGRVVGVDRLARTLKIQAGTSVFPVIVTVGVPPSANLALYPVGAEIAAAVVKSAVDNTLLATLLSRNASFAQADSPLTTVFAPGYNGQYSPGLGANPTVPPVPPNPAHVAAADALKARWIEGRAQGLVPNLGVFESQENRLTRVAALIRAGNKPWAISELDELATVLTTTPATMVAATFRDEILASAAALKAQLA